MEPTTTEPELMTGHEVAALLRVHPKQIYRLLRQGLPGLRVGGEWRFSRADVLGWAARDGAALHPPVGAGEPPMDAGDKPVATLTNGASSESVPPLVAANGDVVIEVLLGQLPRGGPLAGFVQADRGTGQDLLRARRVVAAGVHGAKPPPRLGGERLVLLYLAEREVGLVFARGSRIRRPSDLTSRKVATRPTTAGLRHTLDGWLDTAGLAEGVNRQAREYTSHQEVVLAVTRGEADVGVATAAWAQRAGLGFHALSTEPYALALFASSVGLPVGVALCEVAQSKTLRDRLTAAGYGCASTGTLRFEE